MFIVDKLASVPATKGLQPSSEGVRTPRGKAIALAVRALSAEQATVNALTRELEAFIDQHRGFKLHVQVDVSPGYLAALIINNDKNDQKVNLNG